MTKPIKYVNCNKCKGEGVVIERVRDTDGRINNSVLSEHTGIFPCDNCAGIGLIEQPDIKYVNCPPAPAFTRAWNRLEVDVKAGKFKDWSTAIKSFEFAEYLQEEQRNENKI